MIFANDIILAPGESTTIKTPPGVITLGNKGLLSVSDMGSQIKLVGKKIGQTNLRTGAKKYNVIVVRQNTYKTYQKLSDWVSSRRGLTLTVEDHKIYIRGTFLSYIDWLDLAQFTSDSDDFTIQAAIDAHGKTKINSHLRELSEKNNLPFSDMNTLPNWEISISSQHKNNLSVYKKIFSPYGIKINHSSFALTSIPMIEITILAAEVKRTEFHQFGVSWPASTSFQVLPKLNLGATTLQASIDHLEQKGLGKVLASPKLLTQSGETATFHSGGEFPIKTSNQFNANVIWKQYGIMMKIQPKADFTGKMDVKIECEVSAIDTKTVDNLPGLLINRISSHFNLNETKTIALSGLLREEWDKNRQGLPGLSDLPLFGALFASDSYRNNKTELVFFVTPRIVR